VSVADVMACYGDHADHNPVLVHADFNTPKGLAAALAAQMSHMTNVFVEDQDKLLRQRHKIAAISNSQCSECCLSVS